MRLLPLDPRPGRVIRGLRFSADGRLLAGVSGRADDPRRRPVWFDLGRGAPIEPFPVDRAGRLDGDPAFAPDPRVWAAGWVAPGRAGVTITDRRGDLPQVVRTLALEGDEIASAVEFSANGDELFVGLADRSRAMDEDAARFTRLDVAQWLLSDDALVVVESVPTTGPALATAFADTGGGVFAVGTSDGTAVVVDLFGGTAPITVEHAPDAADLPPVEAVLFSPDGRFLVTRAAGSLAVWDALTGREMARPGAGRPVADCAFTPDGRSLLAVGLDTGVSRFDAPRFGLGERLEFGHGALHSVAVSPDGLTAAAGTGHGTAVLFDL